MLIDDDLLDPHLFILEGLSHRVDPGSGGDLHLEAGEALSHEIDEVRDAEGDGVRPRLIDPLKKFDQLSIAFFGILEVSNAGGVQKVTEFQTIFVADLDKSLDIIPIHLGQDKTGACPSDNIEGEFTEESIHRCSFEGFRKRQIPVGPHPKFHNKTKINMGESFFSREGQERNRSVDLRTKKAPVEGAPAIF
jgi:hypothetical protein